MQTSIGRQALYFLMLLLYVAISFAPFFFLNRSQMLPLIEENGFYQNLTAFAFLAAAVLLFVAYFVQGNGNDFWKVKTRRNIFVLLLAIVFFIGAGEELSWGQHMLGFEPPEKIAEINRQGEFNIHNLPLVSGVDADGNPKTGLASLFTISKLFGMFWLGFCVFIPLLHSASAGARQFLRRVNMPIVPLWIGLVFPLNHILSKIVVSLTGANGHYVMEVKEASFAVLFLLFAFGEYQRCKQLR